MITWRSAIDQALESTIGFSFARSGYLIRKRIDGWTPLDQVDLGGRVIVITGATSGIGLAAARRLARLNAEIIVVGRDRDRNRGAASGLTHDTGNQAISFATADMGDLNQVRSLAREVLRRHDRLDVLIHNAGALSPIRADNSSGVEATVASQVLGPSLLTSLLLARLSQGEPGRVITMSSGGMYGADLMADDIEMGVEIYKGAAQYARVKRAQVTLSEMWADRHRDLDVGFYSTHPGWARTPGLTKSLPRFARLLSFALRNPEQGADTLVWLATQDQMPEPNGSFWHDRRTRPIHRLSRTRHSDTESQRQRLWDWVQQQCEIQDPN